MELRPHAATPYVVSPPSLKGNGCFSSRGAFCAIERPRHYWTAIHCCCCSVGLSSSGLPAAAGQPNAIRQHAYGVASRPPLRTAWEPKELRVCRADSTVREEEEERWRLRQEREQQSQPSAHRGRQSPDQSGARPRRGDQQQRDRHRSVPGEADWWQAGSTSKPVPTPDTRGARPWASLGPADLSKEVPSQPVPVRNSTSLLDMELQQLIQSRHSVRLAEQRQPLLPAAQFQTAAPARPKEGIGRVLAQVAIACMAAYLFGYNLSVVNGPMELMSSELGFGGNSVAKGFVVSIFLVGAFLGCTVSSQVADGLGRRKGFLATALPVLLGSTLSALATSLPMMVAGRLIVGMGLGIGSPLPTLYISEISPPSLRGTLNSLPQVAACMGILAALAAGVYFPVIPQGWRYCFWVGSIPAAGLMFLSERMAESPRWLAQKGRWGEAEDALDSLHGVHGSMVAKKELRELKASMHADTEGPGSHDVSLAALFAPPCRKLVVLGATLFCFQQLSGINSIFYFSSAIFKNAGIESEVVGNVAVGVVNLAAAGLSTYLMDRAGRKTLLGGSFLLMGASLGFQTAFSALSSWFPSIAWLGPQVSLGGTLLYVMSFALGVGPVPGLLLPEIFPTHIRAKGMAVSLCVHWVCNCAVGFSFLPLLDIVGSTGLSMFFCTICFVAAGFTYYWIPETKGKSLEEIEEALSLRE